MARSADLVIRVLIGAAVGVLVFVNGITASAPMLLLLGCALLAFTVILITVEVAATRVENRRELESAVLYFEGPSYAPIGGSLAADLLTRPPHGFRATEDSAVIGTGRATFERAASATLRWEVKTRAGFRVVRVGTSGSFFSDDPVRDGESAVIRFGPVRETVAVVRVVAEPRRRGFAYGTLRRHPLRGEEAFIVTWRNDDSVEFTVRSFSRSHGWWWVLWPVLAIAREVFLRRYLRALLD